jgi:hypothetical protein
MEKEITFSIKTFNPRFGEYIIQHSINKDAPPKKGEEDYNKKIANKSSKAVA